MSAVSTSGRVKFQRRPSCPTRGIREARGTRPWHLAAGLCVLTGATACDGWRLKGTAKSADSIQQTIEPLKKKPLEPIVPTEEKSGTFLLDGRPFCFAGTNNYYLTWKSEDMIADVFQNMKKMDLKVLRHWGFVDRGSLDGSVPSIDGDGTKEGVFFQYWDPTARKPAYNDGPDGLERLDSLMARARENGVRVVLPFVNNWYHFGGMDQYLTWYGLTKHPQFYTDERVKKAYKDWIAHLVQRTNTITGVAYKDDPYLFAWELANEPRIRNYTKFDSDEGWDENTITDWAKEMAAYVRSIDPHHMIAVGDEGFYTGGSEGLYKGEDGVDHDALIALDDIDYGTFHLYPEHWGKGFRFADQWIREHIESARRVGKPTVIEEYGVGVQRDPKDEENATPERDRPAPIIGGWERREPNYHRWNQLILLRGGAGTMFWMIGGIDDYHGRYRDYDGFTVYDPDEDPTARLLADYARKMPTEARACTNPFNTTPRRQVPDGFVTTSTPPSEIATWKPNSSDEVNWEELAWIDATLDRVQP